MKVFVINLAKNTERMASMDAQLKGLGLEYERIEAVYGKALSKEERKTQFAAFRSYCAAGRRLNDGEIGCSLSHCSIYRKMVAEKIPYALILEDDVIIANEVHSTLKAVEDFIDPTKPQVVLLSAHNEKSANSVRIGRIYGGMFTDGYVITLPAAKLLLKVNFPVVTEADRWGRWARWFGLELYKVCPSCIRQDWERFGTDINIFLHHKYRRWWFMLRARLMRPLKAIGLLIELGLYGRRVREMGVKLNCSGN